MASETNLNFPFEEISVNRDSPTSVYVVVRGTASIGTAKYAAGINGQYYVCKTISYGNYFELQFFYDTAAGSVTVDYGYAGLENTCNEALSQYGWSATLQIESPIEDCKKGHFVQNRMDYSSERDSEYTFSEYLERYKNEVGAEKVGLTVYGQEVKDISFTNRQSHEDRPTERTYKEIIQGWTKNKITDYENKKVYKGIDKWRMWVEESICRPYGWYWVSYMSELYVTMGKTKCYKSDFSRKYDRVSIDTVLQSVVPPSLSTLKEGGYKIELGKILKMEKVSSEGQRPDCDKVIGWFKGYEIQWIYCEADGTWYKVKYKVNAVQNADTRLVPGESDFLKYAINKLLTDPESGCFQKKPPEEEGGISAKTLALIGGAAALLMRKKK